MCSFIIDSLIEEFEREEEERKNNENKEKENVQSTIETMNQNIEKFNQNFHDLLNEKKHFKKIENEIMNHYTKIQKQIQPKNLREVKITLMKETINEFIQSETDEDAIVEMIYFSCLQIQNQLGVHKLWGCSLIIPKN